MEDSRSGTSLGTDLVAHAAYSSGTMADIAARVVSEFAHENDGYYDDDIVLYRNDVGSGERKDGEEEEADDNSDFEFQLGGLENSSPICAGEIFSNGWIKPCFSVLNTDPVFRNVDWRSTSESNADEDNRSFSSQAPAPEESSSSSEISAIRLPLRKLLLSERETSLTASGSCSSSEADDLETANPETYCVWTPPKQEICRKSKSTGTSKRWRLRNLVHRSHSDGRDKFVFLAPKQEHSSKPEAPSGSGGGNRKDEKAPATAAVGEAHRDRYLRERATRGSERNKSYLPYKKDLVGLFSNVNGLSRTMQPF